MSSSGGSGLPIEEVVDELCDALSTRRAAVLTAEPGAGKTTIVPLRLLEQPWLAPRVIVMLEPRRLAARAAARRMAHLLGEQVGQTVGYVTRDDRRVGRDTRIEVVTEGILTRRLQRDPSLEGCGLVIFDEFHERNQQGDLGLALLLDARRAGLTDAAVLVMSATIDAHRVAALLDEDPGAVIDCRGRAHPVALNWRPRNRRDRLEDSVVESVAWLLDKSEAYLQTGGDILVFLPGISEMRRTEKALGGRHDLEVHLLHGSLSMADQDRAVSPRTSSRPKLVLSTDIAESSLTVQGVTAVIDSGLARSPRFDVRTGLTRLATVSVSRASADQRSGRAGRTSPGVAVRLWSKLEHGTRARFTPAELTQVDLAPARLELAAWGEKDPASLALLDPLPHKAWEQAGYLLRALGAIDASSITEKGRELARLPLHPRLGSIVLTGRDHDLGRLSCIVATLLEERDVLRGRPAELPADLAIRVKLVSDRQAHHPKASYRAIDQARRRSEDLLARAGIGRGYFDIGRLGLLLAAGYPDRIAQRRSQAPGRFRTRDGTGVVVSVNDPLAREKFVVVADASPRKADAHIRLGAAIDEVDLLAVTGDSAVVTERLRWDDKRGDVTIQVHRQIGALDLGSSARRPDPGPDVTELLLKHVRESELRALSWTDASRALQRRIIFAATREPDRWPDFSTKALGADLETWFGPFLGGARGIADVEIVSVAIALEAYLGDQVCRDLEELVPERMQIAGGPNLSIDYSGADPIVRSRAQDFFTVKGHPTIYGGKLPLSVELLSPAGRPIQRTSDLPGFWGGSWSAVRKAMMGRYPKHDWPKDPRS